MDELKTMKVPVKLTESHISFLENLRREDPVQLLGAVSFLRRRFPELESREAKSIVRYYLRTKKPLETEEKNVRFC